MEQPKQFPAVVCKSTDSSVSPIPLKKLAILTLTLFIYGNLTLGNGGGCVKNAFELYKNSPVTTPDPNNRLIRILEDTPNPEAQKSIQDIDQKSYKEQIRNDKYMRGDVINFIFVDTNLTSPSEILKQNKDTIIDPGLHDLSKSFQNITFTVENAVFILTSEQNGQDWFVTNHTILIDKKCYASVSSSATYLDYEDLVILDIINTFSFDSVFLENQMSQEVWFWSQSELSYLAYGGYLPLYSKISILLFLAIGQAFVSFAASLYTKVVTFLSPLLLYGFINCAWGRCFLTDERAQRLFLSSFYRAFTWLGIYLYALNRNARKVFEPFQIVAHVLTVILLYVMYIALTKLATRLICYKAYPKDMDGNFCGIVAAIELGCLFFLRSKQGLFFGPKVLYLGLLVFLVYQNFTAYGFYNMGIQIQTTFTMSYFFGQLYCFENPSMNLDIEHMDKPSNNRPRGLYQPLFSQTWYHDQPPLWTIFLPFYEREKFTIEEMSLVDQNFQQMNAYLSNMTNRIGFNFGDEDGDLPLDLTGPNLNGNGVQQDVQPVQPVVQNVEMQPIAGGREQPPLQNP